MLEEISTNDFKKGRTEQCINDLEGSTTIYDFTGLKISWVKTLGDLYRVETENNVKGKKKHLKKVNGNAHSWFNVSQLIEIHLDMFGDVWDWAGKFRKSITSIGIKPYLINTELSKLCKDVQAWIKEPLYLTPMEQSARIYHRLLYIHPFINGNSRFALFVLELYLRNYYCSFDLPNLHIKSKSRDVSIKSLKAADMGDYQPLLELLYGLGLRDIPLSKLFAHDRFKRTFSKPKKVDSYVEAITRKEYKFYDINETENNGHSALNILIKYGSEENSIRLIELGADFRSRDRSGCNAFETAINYEKFKTSRVIERMGYRHNKKTSKIPYNKMYKYNLTC